MYLTGKLLVTLLNKCNSCFYKSFDQLEICLSVSVSHPPTACWLYSLFLFIFHFFTSQRTQSILVFFVKGRLMAFESILLARFNTALIIHG